MLDIHSPELKDYKKVLDREWYVEKLYADFSEFSEASIALNTAQKSVLALILCDLAPKDIAEILGKQANAIRNQLASTIVPKLMMLLNLDPDESLHYSDIPKLLAKHGYAISSWSWLQAQAELTYELIKPSKNSLSSDSSDFRDISDASHPTEGKYHIPEVAEQQIVSLEFKFPIDHNLIVLNKGTSQATYCLVPSLYAPQVVGVSQLPMPEHGAIKFSSIGQEQFLAIVSTKRLELTWLDDTNSKGVRKLEEIHLDELAELIAEHEDDVQLYYSNLNVV